MSVFLQVCITALFLPLTVNGDRSSSPACAKPFDKMTACNLICNMIQDSDANNAMKMLQTKLQDLIAAIKNPSPLQPASSCKEHFEKHKWTKSQVYPLVFGSQYVPVYCHMGDFGCGDGGWTLAMKIDGRKRSFHYDSKFWSDKSVYNLPGGKTGFDSQETKLPTYWNTPFSKICLGMKINQQLKFIVINKQSSSLYSLLADGKYRATSLGRSKWKKLIGSQSSLQANCNKEGFNAVGSSRRSSRARIGIIGNNEKDCASTDSRIGFGTGGSTDDKITCGNYAIKGYTSDNGEKHVKAMGYILVQ
ncbi:uncharacterized skeletal organic matrix protein 5-like [Stylophora pistillata]|uniref:uncharacterized skeletal organic matrix protein 5-like n=1 Tax=Stylophora pistillata TaxID=50429 RepID=UPI000C045332|nr:uncharacterized skeletal organic matrix protein 5-like [Stylophora pistillata]